MTTPSGPPPGWYPDQQDPRALRWWDGAVWTEHTAHQSQPAQQPRPVQPRPGGPDPLLLAPVIVVRKEYTSSGGVFGSFLCEFTDGDGRPLGTLGKVDLDDEAQHARIFSGSSREGLGLTEHYQVQDAHGGLALHIARAIRAKTAARPLFEISLGDGTPIGLIQSEKLFGRTITYGFRTPDETRVGGFTSKSMVGPFTVTDQQGNQLADFARDGDRLNTTGYVMRRPHPVPPPLGWLVVASMLSYDIALFGHARP
ncbi:uncharacterized protein DUF2510 [Herbihabitans rhizosphaerae]|uniref:Uncharacterized protein DUF2510 n=1 Tax=Herbihabitans rhizosphaerae TaxID=1872711 RepID=A0A4Q7KR67_9PSEU|nr:DUF2510 domain-containing protein [Herbihabitans rhizosphaerae]RZS39045.1 uncharacterized protein DUF2510 [Herbihabitans rhizosphaerae]